MTENIVLLGDCAMNSNFFNKSPVNDPLEDRINDATIAVTNFEAATDCASPILKTGPNIAASEPLYDTLVELGIDAVTLANNHAMDYGMDGLSATIRACEEHDLKPFGAGSNLEAAFKPLELSVDGTSVGIFGLTEHEIGTTGPDAAGVCWIRAPETLSSISAMAAEYDISIVIAHGGIEYVPIPPPSWRNLLRTIAGLGVDLVVGHHPHNAQGWEIYEGTPICYSLGNFLMYNEYFRGARWGYLVDAELENGEISRISLSFTEARDGQVDLMAGDTGPYHEYLCRSSQILTDDQLYESYWQWIAQRLYDERYRARFADYGQGVLGMLVRYPMYTLDKVTRELAGADVQTESKLGIVDHISNQSHRDVIRGALDLEISRADRQGDGRVEDDLNELFAVIDGRDEQGAIRTWLDRAGTAYERLIR